MAGKYDKLTAQLRAAADRQQSTVDLNFDDLAKLVGGLPASATSRQWWANSSNVQALAWRAAGYHVSSVSLDRRRVRFSLGQVGGSHHDSGGQTVAKPGSKAPTTTTTNTATWTPVDVPVDLRVVLQWTHAGCIELDHLDKPTFVTLPAGPGLYRMTLTGAPGQVRPRIYIGESVNLAHRLAGNYRNPGGTQQTSLRINALLRQHLGSGGRVDLALASTATVYVKAEDGITAAPVRADLSRQSSRLLAENAALVLAYMTDDADIENLG